MAYSRIKIWIAAEILTASDLNNEHNGHITNENDLDTRLISEIASRSTLETEHDNFYAACWNAGSSQIADNRVGLSSMKDNAVDNEVLVAEAVTTTKVSAANKDGAADMPSMRTLGTGALQAVAGNDARLSILANSVTCAKMEHGTLMLPFFDQDNGTEYDDTHDTWTIVTGSFMVYIPPNATVIRAATRQKGHSSAGWSGHLRFYVGSTYSNDSVCNSDSYEWRTDAYLDVSALSGWYSMGIQLHKSGSAHSYLQGYSFIWE